MATRSRIGIKNEDGTIRYIYCHWDGYPSYVGKILEEHYDTPEKINELLDLGSLSILGEVIGEKTDFDYFNDDSDQCLAYHRDRGENWDHTKPRIARLPSDFMKFDSGEEYGYLFMDGKWHVTDGELIAPMNGIYHDYLSSYTDIVEVM